MLPIAYRFKGKTIKALGGTISNYCLFLFVFLGLPFLVISSLFSFFIRPNAAPFWSIARATPPPSPVGTPLALLNSCHKCCSLGSVFFVIAYRHLFQDM